MIQENLTGFIVEVRPRKDNAQIFSQNGEERYLSISAPILGYFQQMTDKKNDGRFHKAHLIEIEIADPEKKSYKELDQITVKIDDVNITIRALRGGNEYPSEFAIYETWTRS